MKIEFGYDIRKISLSIPDKNVLSVLKPNKTPNRSGLTGKAEIERSMDNPIGTPKLEEIVRPGEKVAIITSDITRPVPSYKILPVILKRLYLAGIKKDDITIVFAVGSHRAHTEKEMRYLVGDKVYESVRCVDSVDDFVLVGSSSSGTPFEIFGPVVRADRRICVGNIEFHYFAGYSGGAKAIMPGVSTRNAISANHSKMVLPSAEAGVLEGNPVREDIEEISKFITIDFIVNVVLDETKHIRTCVSGHHVKAHRAGCVYLDSMYRISIPQKADIVIVSPGGYPKDINMYQAQKALDNAKHAVRDGGIIIWLAAAKEGLGENNFQLWMLGHENACDMIPHIQSDFQLGGHKAAAIALVLETARIFLVSELGDSIIRHCHLEPFHDPESALAEALHVMGPDARIIAMPYGGSTLPYYDPTHV
jgi:nickel-dependent lactate racemase